MFQATLHLVKSVNHIHIYNTHKKTPKLYNKIARLL